MADQQHIQWLREGVNSWNAKRLNLGVFCPDFTTASLLSELEGSSCEVRQEFPFSEGFVLDGINLSRGLFRYARLPHFSLREANLEKADFEVAMLSGSDLRNAKLNVANLTGAFLSYADLRGAELIYADFTHAGLAETKLDGANLTNATLTGANLTNATLTGANLTNATLTGANLTNATLTGANLTNATLTGADLTNATLTGADLTNTELWTSILFPDPKDPVTKPSSFTNQVKEVGDLVSIRPSFEDHYEKNLKGTSFNDGYMFYFRGEGNDSWKLSPYIMRNSSERKAILRNKEGEMLLDLTSQRPEDFIGATSALSQWVIAQHHGLKTRLLDITRNPLVALFHACEHPLDAGGSVLHVDGILHIFVVQKDIIKTFDSDAISVVANLAKLPRSEQDRLMGIKLEEDVGGDIYDSDEYSHIMDRLYHYIRQEKPHFKERINIRDFSRVFVVEPQQSFERIRAQSGAFLISAFHERFEPEKIRELNKNTPVYHHYKLTVPADNKNEILNELEFLNITSEVLFPGLDEAAEAIVKRYEKLNS